MKKSRICLTAVSLSLATLLCACTSTPAASLSANWFKDTTLSIGSSVDEIETLVYDVSYAVALDKNGNAPAYTPIYSNATYTTTLRMQNLELSDGTREDCYYLKTEFEADVSFSLYGETSPTFHDSMTSEVWFRSVINALKPVRSKKTATSHTPVSTAPASLSEDYYILFDYEYEVEYDKNISNATVKKHYTRATASQEATEKSSETDIAIKKSTNFFDNEEILFALRATDMTSSLKIYTINPAEAKATGSATVSAPSKKTQSTAIYKADSNAQTESFYMTVNGEPQTVPESIEAYETTIVYDSAMAGQTQSLVYAAKTDTMNNVYRNVLLKMQVPLSYNVGTLTYTLRSAAFADR